jgi:hypothetical protein
MVSRSRTRFDIARFIRTEVLKVVSGLAGTAVRVGLLQH